METGTTASRSKTKRGNGGKTGRKEQKNGSGTKPGWNQGFFRSL
jgi:hypothetical protein